MRLTAPLRWAMSWVVLAAIFFLVVTPVGLLRRVAGGDPAGGAFDRRRGSYWTPRSATEDPERWFRQY
jgi:lauroyl/myristoyl acyltransferase